VGEVQEQVEVVEEAADADAPTVKQMTVTPLPWRNTAVTCQKLTEIIFLIWLCNKCKFSTIFLCSEQVCNVLK
jgi:hypothetical protein